ncbi:MAG: MFS transporter [Clostridia bacterium]|nr:MFS transporter [Clostridia bacterium]
MKFTYKHTLYASYIGYITQAIVNNLSPLLFLTFHNRFGISLELISVLITLNFGVQIITDISAVKLVEKIGFRRGAIWAHILSSIGLVGLALFPHIFSRPYLGLCIATIFTAVGSGLTEVLISPIVDSLPSKEKDTAMSLLHSFYCWGSVLVVLLSTTFFKFFGSEKWYFLPCIWALVPFANIFFFAVVPLAQKITEESGMPFKRLVKSKIFLICLVMMICAGSIEMAMAQWASLFAEAGLGVSKEVGDILGPCMFAVFMGLARMMYGIYGASLKLHKALVISAVFALVSYLVTVFSRSSITALISASMCGLAVGIMWPGTLSLCSKMHSGGNTAMFAYLALGGDIGCTFAPSLVGFISGVAQNFDFQKASIIYAADSVGFGLKCGLLAICAFPVIMLIALKKLKKFENINE